jgi:hypothetical protein
MNTEILNWLVSPWEGDSGGVKRTKRDEPIGVVIHIYIYGNNTRNPPV